MLKIKSESYCTDTGQEVQIATIVECDCIKNCNCTVKVRFLVQNVSFSAKFTTMFNMEIEKQMKKKKSRKEALKLQRQILFDDSKIKEIVERIKEMEQFVLIKSNSLHKKPTRFPANIIKCLFKRKNSKLFLYKSDASVKRRLSSKQLLNQKKKLNDNQKEDLFLNQKCSFSVFSSGTINCTGATTSQDIINILAVLRIFNSYLPS